MEDKSMSVGKWDYLARMSRKLGARHLRCGGVIYSVKSVQYPHGLMWDIRPITIAEIEKFKEDIDVE